jgi:hypothetical protein
MDSSSGLQILILAGLRGICDITGAWLVRANKSFAAVPQRRRIPIAMSMTGHAVEGAVEHVAEETGQRKAASDLFGEYGAGVTCASAVMLFLAIATIDKLTGTELRLQILYLIPVSIVTWTAGRTWGMAFSVVAVAVWVMMIGAAHAYSTKFYFYWEAAVSLGTLIVFVLLLSRLRAALDALEEVHRGRDEKPDHAERNA